MRNFLVLLTFIIAVIGCRGWSAADQADYDKHCPNGSCSINVTKESSPNRCDGPWTSTDCMNKEDPNKGSNPRPTTGGENDNPSEGEPCKTGKDCPGSIEGKSIGDDEDTGGTPNGEGGGGALEGAGDVLTHWGNEIGKGWDGVKSELNGNNAEKRRKKREAKRLMNEMRDLWKQADAYGASVEEDKKGAEASWGLLDDSWQEFGIASREKDLQEFRGRYNTRTKGILDGVPVADPSAFDGLGKGRGDGIYPEHAKVESGRKYLKYARGKLDPNAPDYAIRRTLVDIGDAAMDEAEESYRAGKVQEGNAWYEFGMAAADMALSLTPGVGWAKDVYESWTGRSLLTGKELTKFERSMAMVGALTGGLAKIGAIAKTAKIAGFIGKSAKTAEEAENVAKIGKNAGEIVEAAAKAGVEDKKVIEEVATAVKDGMPCKVAIYVPKIFDRIYGMLVDTAFAIDCVPGSVEEKVAKIFDSAAGTKPVTTPYGDAAQELSKDALVARGKVDDGAKVYRLGTTGKSQTGANAQFWSLEHPNTPGYGGRYGIPPENIANANFIETATVKPGGNYITRPAPPVGTNPGGGIEVVVPKGGVTIDSFTSI